MTTRIQRARTLDISSSGRTVRYCGVVYPCAPGVTRVHMSERVNRTGIDPAAAALIPVGNRGYKKGKEITIK